MESLQRVLGLPECLLKVGHAQTNTPTRHSTQILEPPQLVTFNLFEVASQNKLNLKGKYKYKLV